MLSKNRDFRTLWMATTVSQFGTALGALALTALVSLRASPAEMGVLTAAASTPVLLFALAGGVWVDRLPRRQLMVFADIGRFALLLTVPAVALTDGLRMEQIYAVAFAAGSLDVLFNLAYRSVLPGVVPLADLVDANSKLQISDAVAQTLSPAAGGAIVQAASGPAAVFVDAASFLASGLVVSRMRRASLSSQPQRDSALRESVEGLRAVVGQPALRAIFGMVVSFSFFGGFLVALYGVWVIRELGFSALALGLLSGAGGIGSLLGAGLAGPLTRRFGFGPCITRTYFLAAAALLVIPLAGGPFWLAFGVLLFDQLFGDVLWIVHNVSALSLRQALAPGHQLGRVNATFLLAGQGLRPVGALVAGALASAVGVREALFVAVAGINAAGLWLYLSPVGRIKSASAAEATGD